MANLLHDPYKDRDDLPEDDGTVSKSQRKRDSEALQVLGVALIELSRAQLNKLNLPDKLLTAILDAQRINSRSAIKRQRQYIGRLMRDVDPEPIQVYLESLRGTSDRQSAWLHRIERWREELLADDAALQRLIDEVPDLEIQPLRQTVRNARAERAAENPPKYYRQLFQLLKAAMPEPLATADDADLLPDDEHEDDTDA